MRIVLQQIKEAVVAGIALVVIASCHWGDVEFHQFRPVAPEWGRRDTLEFGLPLLEAGNRWSFGVDVRYTDAYPYRDLWLLVRHNVADSFIWQSDTLRCTLYDTEGCPLGKGLTGLYSIEVPLAVLSSDGGHQPRVQILHRMADSVLVGIQDVGLKVRSASSSSRVAP